MRKLFLSTIIFMILMIGSVVLAQDVYSAYTVKSNEVLMNQATRKFDLIDPTAATSKKNSYFPGFRGANQMIIYTPKFGYRTNTNEFGTEAIVVDNIVTEISGADSLIPKNGLVQLLLIQSTSLALFCRTSITFNIFAKQYLSPVI